MGSLEVPPAPPPEVELDSDLEIEPLTTGDLVVEDQGSGLGPYEIIAEIARGGMGVVYLCRRSGEAGFERLFAVKALHEHLADDEMFVAMLLDEARLAAKIHHHNVASVVELGRSERGYYLVMPYVEGCSLDQLLARSPHYRPPSLIVPIMIGVLNGLHAAHTVEDDDGKPAGLIHRDVSSHNILVGADGDARITDFGIAKARARLTTTAPGVVKGKISLCAPEVFTKDAPVDHRSDQFGAAAVLWCALTGRRLFQGETDAETIERVLHLEIPPPSTVGLRPPPAFDAILLRALERDPERRFPSCAAMAEALRDAALAAGLLGAPSRTARWVREVFADQLAERSRLIRAARPGGTVMVLPRMSPSFLPAPYLEAEHPGPSIAAFILAIAGALAAGILVVLYARGFL
ncbi:MAG: serine/threonine-protein kinase [Myxococcota bacterium]